jgi:hypothetical protein
MENAKASMPGRSRQMHREGHKEAPLAISVSAVPSWFFAASLRRAGAFLTFAHPLLSPGFYS